MDLLTYIETLDHSVFLDVNHSLINPIFDMVFPSLRELTYVFWLFLIIYLWMRKEKKLAFLLIVGILVGALFTYPLKYFIDRQRPYDQIESTRLLTTPESDPSFPSAHAEMSFLAATVVSRFHPEYSKYLYSFSFIVALSRIYVGTHFPADVLGGIIIGVIIGRLMIVLARRKKDIFLEREI
ncbi:MAG: phosphatase PAP2 family protein [Candidatus Methanoperedens sp.]|nr:phosphatase PAP2 family protein [Candidatus Methanoperedens sp.]MCZ7360899.1 phosphatase PAP2 family protein [Candidatus Methanoperedens sp.]HLB69695.1 phosphatase PAP2 family protein [Candidatus Methanoperedens sp.]